MIIKTNCFCNLLILSLLWNENSVSTLACVWFRWGVSLQQQQLPPPPPPPPVLFYHGERVKPPYKYTISAHWNQKSQPAWKQMSTSRSLSKLKRLSAGSSRPQAICRCSGQTLWPGWRRPVQASDQLLRRGIVRDPSGLIGKYSSINSKTD